MEEGGALDPFINYSLPNIFGGLPYMFIYLRIEILSHFSYGRENIRRRAHLTRRSKALACLAPAESLRLFIKNFRGAPFPFDFLLLRTRGMMLLDCIHVTNGHTRSMQYSQLDTLFT